MPKKVVTRRTLPLSVQICPDVRRALSKFCTDRGESLRSAVEIAIRRHIANPPPITEIPPLPPLPPQNAVRKSILT